MLYKYNEFKKNLNKKRITRSMIVQAAYSANKRAKNCRDQKRKYKNRRYDQYDNYEKYLAKEKEYYSYKEMLLSIVKPTCIHHEVYTYNGCVEYLEHDGEYEVTDIYKVKTCTGTEIAYGTIKHHNYYLFYDFGDYSFHTPIEYFDLEKYSDLEIIDIDKLNTFGADITGLCSVQMIEMIVHMIKKGDYIYDDTM